jgi:NADPH:quinone reductase-like Zn-dependent oxidoreductase
VMVGFSSGIGVEDSSLTPRPILFGNFAVLGVLLAYSTQPEAIKRATGWNLMPKSVGDEVHAALTVLLGEGAIHPIVGNVVQFAEIPSALEVFESRQTVGRTVVEL